MTSGVRTGAAGPPERVLRNRTPIPSRPDKNRIRGLRGEVSRLRRVNPEVEIVIQHILEELDRQLDTIWEALDILDKRFDQFEAGDIPTDTEFIEKGRSTQRRKRKVESDEGNATITLLDVITNEIVMEGNKTRNRVKFRFREPLPV